MKYRAEIDGLRAIAVIPVIFFHAGFKNFSGGFVGVDIFFVISGYLITTIILSEKEQGTFSLLNFYERRARRILPSLFLVMFISFPFAWFWLFPSDMKDFSQSLVAVSTFSSNILFWRETGYWGAENELKPLLHTWSLAVEEQYYVLFPLFIILMWKFRKRWIVSSFLFLAAISLMASQWAAYNMPMANFFLLPTRAWELAIGAIISFYILYIDKNQQIHTLFFNKIGSEALSIIGLFLIVYSILSFNDSTQYPGFSALLPTIGAGLVILFASKNTLIGTLLSNKILVFVGLISYSSYLWHQPIFAFSRHRHLTEPSEHEFLILSMMTFSLAYLSWKYVEKPFRSKRVINKNMIFMLSVISSVIFITIGLVGYMTDGYNKFSLKHKPSQEVIDEKLKINFGLSKECDEPFTLSRDCITSNEPNILVWGDSFAMHLIHGILASNPQAKIIQMTKSACGPFFDIAPVDSEYSVTWAEGCLDFTKKVRNWIKGNHYVKYVVVSSPFDQYLFDGAKLLSRSGNISKASIGVVTNEFIKTLDELKSLGITPVVFSPPPANSINLGRCLAKAEWNNLSLDECNFDIAHLSKNRKLAYHFLEEIDKQYRVIRIDHMLCDTSICKVHFDNTWIFRDGGHLSNAGSAALGEKYGFYELILREDHS